MTFVYEMKGDVEQADAAPVLSFLEASCRKSFDHLEWENTQHCFVELKMDKNQKR
ncbi:hypothetical protein [Salinicoccus sp. CNSTN-B1]